jgi:hypothetical protein
MIVNLDCEEMRVGPGFALFSSFSAATPFRMPMPAH